jgi:hypothetical protein
MSAEESKVPEQEGDAAEAKPKLKKNKYPIVEKRSLMCDAVS